MVQYCRLLEHRIKAQSIYDLHTTTSTNYFREVNPAENSRFDFMSAKYVNKNKK